MPEAEGQHLSVKEKAVAWLFGLAVAVLAWTGIDSGSPPPVLWEDLAVAGGIRPPPSPLPGMWRQAAAFLFSQTGFAAGVKTLQYLGPPALGLCAVMAFFLLNELVPDTLRVTMRKKGWSRAIVDFVLMQGAGLFVFSAPVWAAGRAFTPEIAQIMPFLGFFLLMFRALRFASPRLAIAAAALAGFVAADTPLGFAAFAALVICVNVRFSGLDNPFLPGLANPLAKVIALRRMVVAFFAVWGLGVAANATSFANTGGLDAQEWSGFSFFLHYLHGYVQAASAAATPLGWLFIAMVVAGPLLLASRMVVKATDDDRFLPYVSGLFFLAAGLLSFLQSAGWDSFWFWRWTPEPCVPSRSLLCLCMLATSVVSTFALCVFGVEIYFRNYRRIAAIRFQDEVEESSAGKAAVRSFRLVDRAARTALLCEPLVSLLLVLPFRFSGMEREMAGIVNDAIAQTAEECGDAKALFTMGGLEGAVEAAAAMQGKKLVAMSMMYDPTPYTRWLRKRAAEDDEDREMLEAGADNAIRTWVRMKPERATNVALQVGFELWRRDNLPMPECAGLVGRTAGFRPEDKARFVARAGKLARRILAVCEEGSSDDCTDPVLAKYFVFTQWRLARMCRMRADAEDAAGQIDQALADSALADALDAKNPAYARVRRQMDWLALQRNTRITAREGLETWLDRADFRMAQVYARTILESDPGDARANFAMGMAHYIDNQLARAEVYLKRSLERRPGEPAVLNNLAIVQFKLGRKQEAEANAVKALSLKPDSPEIKNTLKFIQTNR